VSRNTSTEEGIVTAQEKPCKVSVMEWKAGGASDEKFATAFIHPRQKASPAAI
jgi:hypothetical protein